MPVTHSKSVPIVVAQHMDDAATLQTVREVLVEAPHVRLHQLGRTDERLAAHLDGLLVAGEDGAAASQAALSTPGLGQFFVSAVLSIQRRDSNQLAKLLSLAEALPEAELALKRAFGWVSASQLRGLTAQLLTSTSAVARRVGIAACAQHGVDAGEAIVSALAHTDAALRAQAASAAGDIGRTDLRPSCLELMGDDNPSTAMAAARAAVLLGDRDTAVQSLGARTSQMGPEQASALAMALKLATPEQAHALLKPLSQAPAQARGLIRGIGIAGDAHYVPWLIKQMGEPKLTRLAGESFSLITGLDLAALDLDRKPPEKAELGPTDDPADDGVALDDDESLPWPDADKLAAWWASNGRRFAPGVRHFLGEIPTPAHCVTVLKTGFQRQRIAAAEYLALLQTGTPRFNVAAPAWRQERRLARMIA